MQTRHRRIWQTGCLILGAALCCIGLLHGESETVLEKAVRICLECIGIG